VPGSGGLITVLWLMLALLPAYSSCADAQGAGTLAIRGGLLDFDLQEFDQQGDRLVHESGPLYGIDADVAFRSRQTEIRFGVAYYGGDVDYDGQTQTRVPINSSTREQLVDLSLMVVYHLPSVVAPALSLYGGPGFRYWRRDIQSAGMASGLDESYRWWKFQAGMEMAWSQEKNRWILDGRVIRALSPEVEINFGDRFDSADLNLGDRWGWRVGGRWIRVLSPRLEATLDLSYQRQRLGNSNTETLKRNGAPVGSVYQPRIEMKNLGVLIGLRRTW